MAFYIIVSHHTILMLYDSYRCFCATIPDTVYHAVDYYSCSDIDELLLLHVAVILILHDTDIYRHQWFYCYDICAQTSRR